MRVSAALRHGHGALLALAAAGGLAAQPPAHAAEAKAAAITALDQGWSPRLRDAFYFTPQGSRLMPYRWFLALERAKDAAPFAAQANMTRYGWAAPLGPNPELNPDDLPVAFVKDTYDDPGVGPWVGMSCAACHTNDITYRGRRLRIDGAPTLADFGAFIIDLTASVNATLADDAKFGRFAAKVLGHAPTPEEAKDLKGAVLVYATGLIGQTWMRTGSLTAGAGRADALNQDITSLAVSDLREPDNLRDPSAPVSYPFLWLTFKQDWVQWTPVAGSPINRNAGEVLGVYGHAQLTGPREGLLKSTVLYRQLYALEHIALELEPPRWPADVFGPVDARLAAQGKALFVRDCARCHNMPPFRMTAKEDNIIGKQFIKVDQVLLSDVKTDPVYTETFIRRYIKTADLGPVLFQGAPVVSAPKFFLETVAAVVERGMADLGLSDQEKMAYHDYRFFPARPGEPPEPWRPAPSAVISLKGGPLLGIWATGPFLHNGSVPNVYELLSPPARRSKVFWVGSHEMDPRKLGYLSTARDLSPAQRKGLFRFDTSLPGNGNGGHDYPAGGYSHAARMAVIEYLKSAELP